MKRNTGGYSSASLITGILGLLLFLLPYIAIIFSIVAVVLSRKDKENGISKSGFITGLIGICLNAIAILFVIVTLILMVG